MAEETIFSKIIRREIPSDIVYQDELVTAFRDISPQAPTHILIVPNVLIPTVNDVTAEHELALGRMMTVAAKIARDEGLADDGYRLIVNCNRHGGGKCTISICICWAVVRLARCWRTKANVMLRTLLGACLAAGYSPGVVHTRRSVSDQQALVMESSVLAAGISASEPAVVATEIQATASSTLYNERQQPVTVHYRFFWYDARGLEMHPLDAPRTIVVPARSSVTLYGSANIPGRIRPAFIFICKG